MSEGPDRTAALVKRSLAPETARPFEDRIDEQATWLKEAITAGRMDNADFAVGLEMELYAVTGAEDDDTAAGAGGTASPQLSRLPEGVFEKTAANKELGLHNVEINTDPTILSETGMRAQVDEIRERTRAAERAASEYDRELVLDAMWTLSPETGAIEYLSAIEERDDVVFAENMRQDPRYVAIDNHALAYTEDGAIPLSVPGVELAFPTILFESLATSIQPHLQVPTAEAFPAYYNAAIRTLGPVLALSSNSPFLPAEVYERVEDPESLVERTHHELRIDVFEQSVNRTPNAKVRVPRDIETTTDIVDRVLEDDRYAPFLREWIEGETDRDTLSDRIWEFDHKRGTYWRWLRCVVGGDHIDSDNGKYSLRIEYRPIPTQPTVTDVIGMQALVTGLIRGLIAAEHPIAELPWEAAESSFYSAVESGLDATLEWVTTAGERTTDRETVFEEIFTHARLGLDAAGLPTEDIERYLSPIEARWEARTTPSGWKKATVRERLRDGADLATAIADMQREYIRRSRKADSFDEWL